MKEDFFIKIETWHKPDFGDQDNVSGQLNFQVSMLPTKRVKADLSCFPSEGRKIPSYLGLQTGFLTDQPTKL